LLPKETSYNEYGLSKRRTLKLEVNIIHIYHQEKSNKKVIMKIQKKQKDDVANYGQTDKRSDERTKVDFYRKSRYVKSEEEKVEKEKAVSCSKVLAIQRLKFDLGFRKISGKLLKVHHRLPLMGKKETLKRLLK